MKLGNDIINSLVDSVASKIKELEIAECDEIENYNKNERSIIRLLTASETRSIHRQQILDEFRLIAISALEGVI